MGRPEDALKELEKALKINPSNIGLINNKGIALIDCKRP
jgi:superkiller protein 3